MTCDPELNSPIHRVCINGIGEKKNNMNSVMDVSEGKCVSYHVTFDY